MSNKVAIVTGAVGIGLGISKRLAEAGAKVVVASRNGQQVQSSTSHLKQLGYEATGIVTDVSQESSVKQMVDTAIETYGQIDILVNNAGIFPTSPISRMSLSDFEQVIDVNLRGVFLCTKYVSERMIARAKGGKIINITSIDALHPSMVGLAHYDASKHGVWGFTKNCALELAEHNIWVNAIAPGGILTPGVTKMSPAAGSDIDQKHIMDSFLSKIPMRRMGEPDDIGKVALFLASDMATYMTGTQIVVDGGVLLS